MAKKKSKYSIETDDSVLAHLDPRLQEVVVRQREGLDQNMALAKTAEDGILCVDVIAELKNVSKSAPGLTVVSSAGAIITGTLDVSRIEEARQDPNVVSLKLASKVGPQLHVSVPEIGATDADLRQAVGPHNTLPTGEGVIVGIVDYGCDFLHQNFIDDNNKTRLLFLWDQSGGATAISPQPYNYGREFDAAAIQTAIDRASAPPSAGSVIEDPNNAAYVHLAYRPGGSAHGTHVMSIAAGNGRGSGIRGIAPEAELIFVDLGGMDVEETDGNFGNSKKLLEAVNYVFEKASVLGRQAVVNLSVGTHGGPHDGSTPAERFFEQLLTVPGRAIVIAAGNSRQIHFGHASGTIAVAASRTLTWQVSQQDFAPSDNELEIWYPHSGSVEVVLIDPEGNEVGSIAPGHPRIVRDTNNQIVARLSHRLDDPSNGDNQIQIMLHEPQAAGGDWKVVLKNTGSGPLSFHAWIERDDFWRGLFQQSQSRFVDADYDAACTLNSIACGTKTIAVASYDARVPGRQISPFSAEGPTRDGRQKPEVAAPGQEIFAARSLTRTRRVAMSGTSMATPHITGTIALLMQVAGRVLTIDEIRSTIATAARRDPPSGNGWNSRFGAGRIGVGAGIEELIGPQPAATAEIPATQGTIPRLGELVAVNGQPGPYGFWHDLASVAVKSRCRVRVQVELEPYK